MCAQKSFPRAVPGAGQNVGPEFPQTHFQSFLRTGQNKVFRRLLEIHFQASPAAGQHVGPENFQKHMFKHFKKIVCAVYYKVELSDMSKC